jgi:hypothetical protein
VLPHPTPQQKAGPPSASLFCPSSESQSSALPSESVRFIFRDGLTTAAWRRCRPVALPAPDPQKMWHQPCRLPECGSLIPCSMALLTQVVLAWHVAAHLTWRAETSAALFAPPEPVSPPSRPFIFCHASALPEREFGFYFSKPRSALQPLLAQMERLTWGGVGST